MTAGVAQRYQYVVPEFTPPEAEGHLVVLRSFIFAFGNNYIMLCALNSAYRMPPAASRLPQP